MRDTAPHPELLSALGRLVRGLSLLFWGLPIALVIGIQSVYGDWFRPLGIGPALLASTLLCYGLSLLGHFQKQERPWIAALDRARILAFVNLGLSPFLYWWSRVPAHPFLAAVVQALVFTGLIFLICLNPLLARLAAMLPDETLRAETRLFTTINRVLLTFILALVSIYFLAMRFDPGLPEKFFGWVLGFFPVTRYSGLLVALFEQSRSTIIIFLVLLPLAMTMALIWKIKEVILASVFGPDH
jgi:hypothetical protein